MSEEASTTPPKIYSLRQVATAIKRALESATGGRLWLIRAEVVKVTGSLGRGHLYLDLIDQSQGGTRAKMRGMIWAGHGAGILIELGEDAKTVLAPGSEIVFSARVAFHEEHGLSLSIEKIELQHMLGEMERRRQATIKQLKASGAIALNGRLPAPSLPLRVALVGSKGTSGYRDFATKIIGSGFRIAVQTFHTTVQGNEAPKAIKAALREAEVWAPDLIVLLRGGGSKIDLACFDDLSLCLTISDLTRPVWTGIGHESDLSVADMCANRMFKTPTDVAVGIINCFEEALGQLQDLRLRVTQLAQAGLQQQRRETQNLGDSVSSHSRQAIAKRRQQVDSFGAQVGQSTQATLRALRSELKRSQSEIERLATVAMNQRAEALQGLAYTINAFHPDRTLERGFAIVRGPDAGVLKSPEALIQDQLIDVELRNHFLQARVTGWRKKSETTIEITNDENK